jgi:hypothetical protein
LIGLIIGGRRELRRCFELKPRELGDAATGSHFLEHRQALLIVASLGLGDVRIDTDMRGNR